MFSAAAPRVEHPLKGERAVCISADLRGVVGDKTVTERVHANAIGTIWCRRAFPTTFFPKHVCAHVDTLEGSLSYAERWDAWEMAERTDKSEKSSGAAEEDPREDPSQQDSQPNQGRLIVNYVP